MDAGAAADAPTSAVDADEWIQSSEAISLAKAASARDGDPAPAAEPRAGLGALFAWLLPAALLAAAAAMLPLARSHRMIVAYAAGGPDCSQAMVAVSKRSFFGLPRDGVPTTSGKPVSAKLILYKIEAANGSATEIARFNPLATWDGGNSARLLARPRQLPDGSWIATLSGCPADETQCSSVSYKLGNKPGMEPEQLSREPEASPEEIATAQKCSATIEHDILGGPDIVAIGPVSGPWRRIASHDQGRWGAPNAKPASK
jgi:hypothetical protein